MTLSENELEQRWHAAYCAPRGRAKFEAMDAVLRHADAAGLTKAAFEWRLSAMSEFHHGGDPTRLFLAFSHCLSAWDNDAEVGNHHTEHRLLWNFKWVIWSLPQFPEIPLERTQAVLDDMQVRYQRSGHSLHAVYQHRWLVAHHMGDPAADHWYDRMITTARDGLSDCAACVPSAQVRHLVSRGLDEEAIVVGEPYSRGGCTEQPQWMLAELLLPYLRTGRHEKFVEAHRTGYPLMKGDPHHLDNIALHLFACGRSGNEARGLELIERHRGWLVSPSSPYAAMEFATAAAWVLRRLTQQGHGDTPLKAAPGADPGTVATVGAELTAMAQEIAARFDARNGNTHQSGRVDERLTAEPLIDRLPLTFASGHRVDADSTLTALWEQVAAATAAGDSNRAGKSLLAAARHLNGIRRYSDAIEATEEAVRALDRAGDTVTAREGRLLLWSLYGWRYNDTPESDALLNDLLSDPGLEHFDRVAVLLRGAFLSRDVDRAEEMGRTALETARSAFADSPSRATALLLATALRQQDEEFGSLVDEWQLGALVEDFDDVDDDELIELARNLDQPTEST